MVWFGRLPRGAGTERGAAVSKPSTATARDVLPYIIGSLDLEISNYSFLDLGL